MGCDRKISVIIPVFNTENYLEKCIDSVKNQTYRNLEVIMVDDESKDNSFGIMQKYSSVDERFISISIKHGGLSAARNAGLKIASGDFYSFIDSDDWIELNYYETMLDLIDAYSADAAYLDWMDEFSNGKSDARGNDGRTIKEYCKPDIINESLRHKTSIRISSGLISKKMMEGLEFEIRSTSGEELLFNFFSLLRANKVVYRNCPYYHRYFREGSLSTKKGFNPYNFGKPECASRIYEYVKEYNDEYLGCALENVVIQNITIINHMLLFGTEEEYDEEYRKLISSLSSALKKKKEFGVFFSSSKYEFIYWMIKNLSIVYKFIVTFYYRTIKKGL